MRVVQLLRAVRAQPLDETELQYIRGLLNEPQAELFFGLMTYEQRHALNVCRTLVSGGFGDDRELLQAALLHDLGKRDPDNNRHVPIWGKCANVLLSAIGGKNLVARLASPNPQSWRYVFYLQTGHEARSAQLATRARSTSKVIALVGDYHALEQRGDPAAKALAWADDLN
jgi:hypothetical protein